MEDTKKTPEKVMKILRHAFAKVSQDPEARAEAAKVKMTIDYQPADECRKVMDDLLNQPPDVVAEFGKYIKF